MIALDTSVVVPVFASWHEAHRTAVTLLADEPTIPTHVALETYSVLTRLPSPHRVPASVVIEYLERVFPPERRLATSSVLQRELPQRCADLDIDGGAAYDALVAAVAADHDATLFTRDRRAAPIYRAIGVDLTLVG